MGGCPRGRPPEKIVCGGLAGGWGAGGSGLRSENWFLGGWGAKSWLFGDWGLCIRCWGLLGRGLGFGTLALGCSLRALRAAFEVVRG